MRELGKSRITSEGRRSVAMSMSELCVDEKPSLTHPPTIHAVPSKDNLLSTWRSSSPSFVSRVEGSSTSIHGRPSFYGAVQTVLNAEAGLTCCEGPIDAGGGFEAS